MRFALVLACLVALLAGCSTSEAGTPRPADPGVPASEEPAPEEANPLDGVGQCDLLTPDDLKQIGLEPGEPLGDLSCDHVQDERSGVLVTLFPEDGAEGRGDSGTPVDVGDAYLQENPSGGQGACRIVLPTSVTSYVLIVAVTGSDTDLACELATVVAQHIYSGLS